MAEIILIEDDEKARVHYRAILEKQGFTVREARNGQEGFELFAEGRAQLIITDLIMDEVDGIEVIRDVLKHDPDMPIIAISGGGMGEPGPYLLASKSFGAKMALSKPISAEQLTESVRECIANRA